MDKSVIYLYENETFFLPSDHLSTLHIEYLPNSGLFLPASINVNMVETCKTEVQQHGSPLTGLADVIHKVSEEICSE